MDFITELEWRGMIHDIMPGAKEKLSSEKITGYIGFDPTSDSLHVGSLVQIMLLMHFQKKGHKPIALVGGATGLIGDPSGKSAERKLLSIDEIKHNESCIKKQLQKFLDFKCGENSAEIVNNNDWHKNITFLDLLRDIGKHLTLNYMMAKDSVQSRLETGISFTEFSYQLLQAFDFYWLLKNKNCRLQMGGSDQWGNILSGIELIRRKGEGSSIGFTCPLITKADGGKFGKTEEGNIWLDPQKTSPYKFYQFWLNVPDEEAIKYIRFFTLLSQEEVNLLEKSHLVSPHLRILQHALAKDVTVRVHSENDYNMAVKASEILFGKGTTETLQELDESILLSVFEGVPQVELLKSEFECTENVTDLLSEKTKAIIFNSKGEARKMIQGGGVSINKLKISDPNQKLDFTLLQKKYLLAQKGKKSYFLIKIV